MSLSLSVIFVFLLVFVFVFAVRSSHNTWMCIKSTGALMPIKSNTINIKFQGDFEDPDFCMRYYHCDKNLRVRRIQFFLNSRRVLFLNFARLPWNTVPLATSFNQLMTRYSIQNPLHVGGKLLEKGDELVLFPHLGNRQLFVGRLGGLWHQEWFASGLVKRDSLKLKFVWKFLNSF